MHNAVSDFVRKEKRRKNIEIELTATIDINVSLSTYDEGTFFDFNDSDNVSFSDIRNETAFYSLTKKERTIFSLLADGLSIADIAKILKINEQNIYSSISYARKKFKERREK